MHASGSRILRVRHLITSISRKLGFIVRGKPMLHGGTLTDDEFESYRKTYEDFFKVISCGLYEMAKALFPSSKSYFEHDRDYDLRIFFPACEDYMKTQWSKRKNGFDYKVLDTMNAEWHKIQVFPRIIECLDTSYKNLEALNEAIRRYTSYTCKNWGQVHDLHTTLTERLSAAKKTLNATTVDKLLDAKCFIIQAVRSEITLYPGICRAMLYQLGSVLENDKREILPKLKKHNLENESLLESFRLFFPKGQFPADLNVDEKEKEGERRKTTLYSEILCRIALQKKTDTFEDASYADPNRIRKAYMQMSK
jgi:hypothetical protein